jgi:hypothetical protein
VHPPPPIYLVELLNPLSGELDDADVYARLDTAVEKAYVHCLNQAVHVDVSADESSLIEGVAFFDAQGELLACVTAYQMDRDNEVPTIAEVALACSAGAAEMKEQLTVLLRP